MDRGTWWATCHGIAKSRTQLRDEHCLSQLGLLQQMNTINVAVSSSGGQKAKIKSQHGWVLVEAFFLACGQPPCCILKWQIDSFGLLGMSVKSFQLRPTLCDPIDCSAPGSSVRGILQARILERVAVSSSRGSSPPRDRTCISCGSRVAGGFFTAEPPGEPSGLLTC